MLLQELIKPALRIADAAREGYEDYGIISSEYGEEGKLKIQLRYGAFRNFFKDIETVEKIGQKWRLKALVGDDVEVITFINSEEIKDVDTTFRIKNVKEQFHGNKNI